VSIIKTAMALCILLSVMNLNGTGRNGISLPGDNGFAVGPIPDEVHHLFETYHEEIDTAGIRERLHWVAVFLKGNPDFEAFIISYAGQSSCPGEAARRAKIAKQFLTNQERVLSKQLKTINGGYRMKWVVELWFGPKRAKGYPPVGDIIDPKVVRIERKCPSVAPLR
jgi:hypothetical protein